MTFATAAVAMSEAAAVATTALPAIETVAATTALPAIETAASAIPSFAEVGGLSSTAMGGDAIGALNGAALTSGATSGVLPVAEQ